MSGRSSSPGPNRVVVETPCANLVINTQIATPIPGVVSTLKKGDILEVSVASATGPINLITSKGKLAGSILSRNQARLLSCINSGTEFVAEVISVKGAHCEVQIRAK